MDLTVAGYAKHFGMALHLQNSKEEDVRAHARAARSAGAAACYTNSFWTPVVAEGLRDSDVGVDTAISFPYGCTSADMKFAEIERGLRLRATVVDVVVNIGRLHEGDNEFTRHEVEGLVERTKETALSEVTLEVCSLTSEEIARLTRIYSDAGVDCVKTMTESQGFPTEAQVQVIRDNITDDNTKLKVSGIPRTFTMPVTLWMVEQFGVLPIGTRLTANLIQQYAAHLDTN